MQTKKIGIAQIKSAMTKNEMKKIVAGSGIGCSTKTCNTDSDCSGECNHCGPMEGTAHFCKLSY